MVRWLLLVITGGMSGYILYALGFIRPDLWGLLPEMAWIGKAMMIALVAIGALLPLGIVAGAEES